MRLRQGTVCLSVSAWPCDAGSGGAANTNTHRPRMLTPPPARPADGASPPWPLRRLSNVPLHKAQKLRANHQVDPYAELLAGPEGLEPWKAVAKREEQLAAQMQDWWVAAAAATVLLPAAPLC